MFICLNGGPKFLIRLILISKLTPAFLFKQTELTVQGNTSVAADVKAIIHDGNQVNQIFYITLPENPWLTEYNKYLLFDYVHL